MTLLAHLGHSPAARAPRRRQSPPARPDRALPDVPANDDEQLIDGRVYAVQRLGAAAVALVLLLFGLLGATSGVPFLDTHGEQVLGMSSNGLLSMLSLVVAAVLAGADLRGPRTASTVMIALGVLFLLSGLANLALLRTSLNVLAFQFSNVVFSAVVGLLLLLLGAYGRLSGNLPASSPYAHPHRTDDDPEELPATPQELATEAAMREAEIAVVQHYATEDQSHRVAAMAAVRTRGERRRAWLQSDPPRQQGS
jgi:hypothetical protein